MPVSFFNSSWAMKFILIIAVLTAIVLSEGSEYDNRVLLKDDVVRIYAEALYNKRSTISTLLQWNSDLFHGFQHINGIKPYKITESTRVHVVGHSTKATKTTVGNCNAEQIGNILSLLTSQSNVKRISLVSCTLHDPSSTSGASESFAGHHRSVTTELSVRTAPVAVLASGKKLLDHVKDLGLRIPKLLQLWLKMVT